jgi:beta-lactamase regulating signal transducer with metallopeptidase domain
MGDDTLWRIVIGASLPALLVWGLTAAMRRAPAALRSPAWRACLAAFWLAPALALVWTGMGIDGTTIRLPVLPAETAAPWPPPAPPERPAVAPASSQLPAATAAVGPPRSSVGRWEQLALAVWLLGAAAASTWLIRDGLAVAALGRTARAVNDPELQARVARWAERVGLRRAPALLQSEAVEVPTLIGSRHPALLLPAGPVQRRNGLDAVLVHELAHVERGDVLLLLLARATRALWWWNPLAWVVVRELRFAAEEACDDCAVALTGERRTYADLLVTWAATAAGAGLSACDYGGRALIRRIARILDGGHPRVVRAGWPARGLVPLALLGLVAALGLVRVEAVPGHAAGAAPPARPTGSGLAGGVSIPGIVTDEAGKPLGGVEVWLVGRDPSHKGERLILGRAQTGADGRFAVPGSDEDSFRMHDAGNVVAFTGGRGLDWRQVTPTALEQGVRLMLGPAQPMAGQVTDEAGRGIAGAAVTIDNVCGPDPRVFDLLPLRSAVLGDLARVTCDREGRFRYDYCPRGKAVGLTIEAPGYAPRSGHVCPVGDGWQWPGFTSDSKTVDPANLSFTLVVSGDIQGKVLLPDGKPAVGVEVDTMNAAIRSYERATTDADGAFLLQRLRPRLYELYVHKDGYVCGAVEVRVESGKTARTVVRLSRGGFVRGQVRNRDTGEPIAGATVMIEEAGTTWPGTRSAFTNRKGLYQVRVMPGEVTVLPLHIDSGTLWYHIPQEKRKVVVREGQRTEGVGFEVAVERRWQMPKVVVVDPGGKPLAGAEVSCSTYWEAFPVITGADGVPRFFSVGHAPGKPVSLKVLQRERRLGTWAAVMPHPPGEAAKTVTVRTKPCVRVEGRVVTADGKPAPRARLTLIANYVPRRAILVDETVADAQGRFVFETGLPGVTQSISAYLPALDGVPVQEGSASARREPSEEVVVTVHPTAMGGPGP